LVLLVLAVLLCKGIGVVCIPLLTTVEPRGMMAFFGDFDGTILKSDTVKDADGRETGKV
jgi:hypothetical protein